MIQNMRAILPLYRGQLATDPLRAPSIASIAEPLSSDDPVNSQHHIGPHDLGVCAAEVMEGGGGGISIHQSAWMAGTWLVGAVRIRVPTVDGAAIGR